MKNNKSNVSEQKVLASDVVKFRVTLSIGLSGAVHDEVITAPKCEVPTDPADLEEYRQNLWREWSSNYIDGGISEVE